MHVGKFKYSLHKFSETIQLLYCYVEHNLGQTAFSFDNNITSVNFLSPVYFIFFIKLKNGNHLFKFTC